MDDGATIDDAGPPTAAGEPPRAHPLDGWSEERIAQVLAEDPKSLGALSVGSPNAGRLIHGVKFPEGEAWELIDPAHAWGTEETIEGIQHCAQRVVAEHPGGSKLYIGHVSDEDGGPLKPHLSHQAGRDVDVSYYYTGDARWFARATAKNLDRERTWTFVKALITDTDVELILIDASLQRLLQEHALAVGEDPDWLTSIFQGAPGQRALIRHARGHATHIHVRFYSPIARETARRVLPAMVAAGLAEPPLRYVSHRAKRGDTLAKLAQRYGTTVPAIMRANGLKSTMIVASRTYRIPQDGPPPYPTTPITVPPRRLPP